MIHFVTSDTTLDLRSRYLRSGIDPKLCRFDGDDAAGTFHLAWMEGNVPVSISSFMRNGLTDREGLGYQLRGMVTDTSFQRRGLGAQIVNFAIEHLRNINADYLWCNSRKVAYGFYLSIGFVFASDEFEIAGIGPHRKMILNLRKGENDLTH